MNNSPMALSLQVDDWEQSPLQKQSVFIKDGTHGTHKRIANGVPLLSAKNVTASGNVIWDDEDSQISEDEYKKIHAKYELQKDDLLLTVVGTLGRRALVTGKGKYTIQRSVAVIRPETSSLLPEFLFQYAGSDYFQHQLELRSNATAQAGVYLGELGKIPAPLPPLPEQQKIAKILTSVDEVIEQTQAQIDKLKDLKTGMMQELLTKGIGHTEFKDSPVGIIPVGWETGLLTNFAEINPKLNQLTALTDSLKVSFIKMEDVSVIAKITNMRIRKYSEVAKGFTKFNNNDVLMAKITPCFENGKGGYAEDLTNGVGFGSTEFHVIRARSNADSRYLFHYSNFPSFRLKATASMCGTGGQRRVQTDFLKTHQVSFPPLTEQKRIAKILTSIDERIDNIERKMASLKNTKKALMQDLLTGKVRVNTAQTTPEVAVS
jgi:type I restriction enzyme S subunit